MVRAPINYTTVDNNWGCEIEGLRHTTSLLTQEALAAIEVLPVQRVLEFN